MNSPDLEPVQKIKNNTSHIDKLVKKALDTRNKEWRQKANRLIYQQHRLYVSQSNKLRENIIKIHHDNILARHPRYHKTLELINHNYWWPCITKQIQIYIIGYDTCQRTKAYYKRKHAPLNLNEIPSVLWEIILVDLIKELPMSQEFNTIYVIVDYFNKQIYVIPTNTKH